MNNPQQILEQARKIPAIGYIDSALSGARPLKDYAEVARAIFDVVNAAVELVKENERLTKELVETQQALARLVVKRGLE